MSWDGLLQCANKAVAFTILQQPDQPAKVWKQWNLQCNDLCYPVFVSLFRLELKSLWQALLKTGAQYQVPDAADSLAVLQMLSYWWLQCEKHYCFDIWRDPANSFVNGAIRLKKTMTEVRSLPAPEEFYASSEEAQFFQLWVEVVDIVGKGKGVRAKRTIPAGVFVGVLPGRLFTLKQHRQRLEDSSPETSNQYAMQTTSATGSQWVIDAEDDVGHIPEKYASSVGHLFNEALLHGDHISVSWVRNWTLGPIKRFEAYTNREISAGTELLADYGEGYDRSNYPREIMQARVAQQEMWTYNIQADRQMRKVWGNTSWEEWENLTAVFT